MRYGFLSVTFVGGPVIREHCGKSPLSIFPYRDEDVIPPGEVGVLTYAAWFVEYIKLSAGNRTDGVDGA